MSSNYFDSNSALPLAPLLNVNNFSHTSLCRITCDVGRLRAHELYGDWTAMIIFSIYVIDNFTSIDKNKVRQTLSNPSNFLTNCWEAYAKPVY